MASLDTLVHVTYRVARVRAAATDLVFSSAANPLKRAAYRQALYERALELQSEHNTLLYGGRIMLEVRRVSSRPRPAVDSMVCQWRLQRSVPSRACLQQGCTFQLRAMASLR